MENEQSTNELEPIAYVIGVIEYHCENERSCVNLDDIKTFKSIEGASQYILNRVNEIVAQYGKEKISMNLGNIPTGTAGEFKIQILNETNDFISFAYSEIPLYE